MKVFAGFLLMEVLSFGIKFDRDFLVACETAFASLNFFLSGFGNCSVFSECNQFLEKDCPNFLMFGRTLKHLRK